MSTETNRDRHKPIAPRTTAVALRLPSGASLALARVVFELRGFVRRRDGLFFVFAFPIVLLTIFATAFQNADMGRGLTGAQYYLPAMLASGILTIGTQNLGVQISEERYDDTRKRLAGTPLSPTSYLLGKIGQVLVTGLVQAMLLVLIGHVAFDISLPNTPERWFTFTWILLLGLITSAIAGIAIAHIPRSGKSASTVITPIVLVLQFISGVYLPFSLMPGWLQNIAALFPLKWLAQGMRSVFLPDTLATIEQGGTWNHAGVALTLTLWLILGAVVARAMFRWIPRV
ncbi:MAG: ABC transporter permease [Ancrocorticia sp.]